MTEIDPKNSLTSNQAGSGLSVVRVEARFHQNVSPNTARHVGNALLAFRSAKFDTRIIGPVLKNSGQSSGELIGETEQTLPQDSNWENSLQEFPDGTYVHISEEVQTPELLNQAPKPAVVQQEGNKNITGRENTRRLIMHVISTSDDPGNYGIKDWFTKNEIKELKPAA